MSGHRRTRLGGLSLEMLRRYSTYILGTAAILGLFFLVMKGLNDARSQQREDDIRSMRVK